jgi:hypothetical protein
MTHVREHAVSHITTQATLAQRLNIFEHTYCCLACPQVRVQEIGVTLHFHMLCECPMETHISKDIMFIIEHLKALH